MATEVELLQKKIIEMLESEVDRLKKELDALKNPPLRWNPTMTPHFPETIKPFITWETTSTSDPVVLDLLKKEKK